MSRFKKSVDNKHLNPIYRKIEKLLTLHGLNINIAYVYYLGGSYYNPDVYNKALLAIEQNQLKTFLQNYLYDVHADNIEFYQITYNSDTSKLLVIYDPIELYWNDELLNVFPVNDNLNDLDREKIFSSH